MNLPTPIPRPGRFPFARQAQQALQAFLNLVYPPHCALCRAETPPREHLCAACRKTAQRIASPFCEICSTPFEGQIEGPFACPACRENKHDFDCAIVPYLSRGAVRELIHRFKYNHHFHLRHVLAGWLLEALADPRLQALPFDQIVPVPLHPARERDRGFNQARVLAQFLARQTGIPMANALRRTRFTTTQTRLDRETRIENLRNAFEMRHTVEVQNLHLLLIDDVLTTGATVNECARVLKRAGASSVRVVTVARG